LLIDRIQSWTIARRQLGKAAMRRGRHQLNIASQACKFATRIDQGEITSSRPQISTPAATAARVMELQQFLHIQQVPISCCC
jgi:hypothetical protein